jgi:hypothetical protein
MFFTFPEDARWNEERQALEFGVVIGGYEGVVRVPRRVFQRLLPERPTPERPTIPPLGGNLRHGVSMSSCCVTRRLKSG